MLGGGAGTVGMGAGFIGVTAAVTGTAAGATAGATTPGTTGAITGGISAGATAPFCHVLKSAIVRSAIFSIVAGGTIDHGSPAVPGTLS